MDELVRQYELAMQLGQQVHAVTKGQKQCGDMLYSLAGGVMWHAQITMLHDQYTQLLNRQREMVDRQKRSQAYSRAPDGRSLEEVRIDTPA